MVLHIQEDDLREIHIDSSDCPEKDRTLLRAPDWKTVLLSQLFRGAALGTAASSTARHETGNRHVTGGVVSEDSVS